MRVWIFVSTLVLFACACASDPKRKPLDQSSPEPDALPTGVALAPISGASDAGPQKQPKNCIIVQGDFGGQPAVVEGKLVAATAKDGKRPAAPHVLQLTHPRCIVGLEHASFIAEVYVATADVDVRPFVDMRVRIRGDVLGGMNDMGGVAVVVLAKDVERLPPPSDIGD